MFSTLKPIRRLSILTVGIVATAVVAWVSNKASFVTAALPATADPSAVVVAFKGDSLHDLARLLRPMSFTVSPETDKATTLDLRDAIYAGAVDGRAKLLTVWVATREDSPLLSSFDANKPLAEVASTLAGDQLANATFAVIPVEVGWKDWQLTVVRSGAAVVKGSDASANQLQEAISNSPSLLASTDTRNVSIPVGLGQSAPVAMQPWFEANRVVIQMRLMPTATISTALPDMTGLETEGGLILGVDFLNQIFSTQHKDLLVGNNNDHARNFQFSAQADKFTVIADYKEAPAPITAKLAAVFEGANLAFSRLSTQINCGTPASPECNAFKLELTAKAAIVMLKRGQPLQPTDAQTLGNFNIGTKVLNGTSRFSRIQSTNGAVVLPGVFRLRGGTLS